MDFSWIYSPWGVLIVSPFNYCKFCIATCLVNYVHFCSVLSVPLSVMSCMVLTYIEFWHICLWMYPCLRSPCVILFIWNCNPVLPCLSQADCLSSSKWRCSFFGRSIIMKECHLSNPCIIYPWFLTSTLNSDLRINLMYTPGVYLVGPCSCKFHAELCGSFHVHIYLASRLLLSFPHLLFDFDASKLCYFGDHTVFDWLWSE